MNSAATDTPGRLFLSYASQDRAIADALCRALEEAGLPCWIAPRDVPPGHSYAATIVEAINACRMLVLVLSRAAAASPHVLREVERASSKQRPILPIRCDDSELTPDFEYFISTNQWIDATGGPVERIVPTLIEAVRRGGRMSGVVPRAAASPPTAVLAPERTGKQEARSAWPKVVLSLAGMLMGLAFAFGDRLFPARHAGESAEPASTAASAPASPAATAVGKSVAVLPFADLSEKKDQEYFSDGLSDELISLLGRIPGLHVPARTSSFYFKGKQATLADVGKALNVTTVLEGSVRKAGNRLRISAELVNVANDQRIWSQSFDRKLDDVFKVQDEIAGAVVHALQLSLLAPAANGNKTDNSEAYNHYLLGRQFLARFNGAGSVRASEEFSVATSLDPAFAAAWAGLADARYWQADNAETAAGMETNRSSARAAADRALELQPELVYGLLIRGQIRITLDRDFVAGGADLERALALDPDNSDVLVAYASSLCLSKGRFEEAERMLRKATVVDPLNARVWTFLGFTLLSGGDGAAARAALDRSLEINPQQIYAPGLLAAIDLLEGNPSEALARSQRSMLGPFQLVDAAMALHDLGRQSEAAAALQELIAKYSFGAAVQIADVYAWRGDKDRAFEWLARARAQNDSGLIYVKYDPLLRKLRDDPRFEQWLRESNLE